MENLFVQPLEFEKTALKEKLSSNYSEWPEEIINYFHEEYPKLANLPISLDFTEQDGEKGYAVGSLTVGGKVALPFVAKEFVLASFDVAIFEESVVPFNEHTVDLLFSNESAFSGLSREENLDTVKRLFSTSLHNIDTIEKRSSVIEKISKGITKEAKDSFMEKVAQYEEYFRSNDTWDVVEKIAALEPESMVMDEDLAKNSLPRDIYMIEKTGKFEYTAFLGSSKVDALEKVVISPGHVKEAELFLEKSAAVKQYQELEVTSDIVKTADILDFDGSETGLELQTDDSLNYKVASCKKPHKKKQAKNKTKLTQVKQGSYGTFIFDEGVSKPLYVEKIAKISGQILATVFDGLDTSSLVFDENIKTASASKDSGTDFYLPFDTEFEELGHLKESMVNLEGNMQTPHSVSRDSNTYYFSGPVFSKYAELGHQVEDLNSTDAKWLMLQTGVSPLELEKIALDKKGKHYFQSELSCPMSFNEYLDDQNEKIAKELHIFEDEELDLIKNAATLAEKGTVDAVLSLNFLSKKNVAYYIEAVPLYEEALSHLARLLLGSRLGFQQISEDAIKEAMESLSKVVRSLYEADKVLKTIQKKGA